MNSSSVEARKLLKDTYKQAKAIEPCMIIIEHFDLLNTNGKEDEELYKIRSLKNEFLVFIQEVFCRDDHQIYNVYICKNPWNLDPVIRKRYSKRLYIPLPNDDLRREIFETKLKKLQSFQIDEKAIDQLVEKTSGFSVKELLNTLNDAVEETEKYLQNSSHCEEAATTDLNAKLPIPDKPAGNESSEVNQVKDLQLNEKLLSNLLKIVENSKPSISQDEIAKYEQFYQDFCA